MAKWFVTGRTKMEAADKYSKLLNSSPLQHRLDSFSFKKNLNLFVQVEWTKMGILNEIKNNNWKPEWKIGIKEWVKGLFFQFSYYDIFSDYPWSKEVVFIFVSEERQNILLKIQERKILFSLLVSPIKWKVAESHYECFPFLEALPVNLWLSTLEILTLKSFDTYRYFHLSRDIFPEIKEFAYYVHPSMWQSLAQPQTGWMNIDAHGYDPIADYNFKLKNEFIRRIITSQFEKLCNLFGLVDTRCKAAFEHFDLKVIGDNIHWRSPNTYICNSYAESAEKYFRFGYRYRLVEKYTIFSSGEINICDRNGECTIYDISSVPRIYLYQFWIALAQAELLVLLSNETIGEEEGKSILNGSATTLGRYLLQNDIISLLPNSILPKEIINIIFYYHLEEKPMKFWKFFTNIKNLVNCGKIVK